MTAVGSCVVWAKRHQGELAGEPVAGAVGPGADDDLAGRRAGADDLQLTGRSTSGARCLPQRYCALMTVKLVVLYTPPADADGFDEHYLGVHGPLAQTIPGLLHFESARLVGAADGGAQTYSRIAELSFADQAALEAALGSEQGKATAADYQQIAPPGSRMFVAAVDE